MREESIVKVHSTRELLSGLSHLEISRGMTEDDAAGSMRFLESFNECMLGAVRFSGETPWERHPEGDELLCVLEGHVVVTILSDSGQDSFPLTEGTVCVVPKGLWHRQRADSGAAVLFATPTEGTENSWAEDPRST
jgi:mannose-6-phosphate isomerase-like protein (cupin superfamily)